MPKKHNKQVIFLSIVLIFFIFGTLKTFAQPDTVYVDEYNNYISKKYFYKKANSSVFKGLRYSTDTLILEKIKPQYLFGKLLQPVNSQLSKLFFTRHNIDTTKTLIIHYYDTLKTENEYPKKSFTKFYDSLNTEIKIPKRSTYVNFEEIRSVFKHEHIQNYQSFLQSDKKCLKYHKKMSDQVLVLHFYNHNNGHPEQVKKLKWFKDYGSLVKKLFSYDHNFDFVIIKPNGEFYVQYYKTKLSYEGLVLNLKWNNYKKLFEDNMKSFSVN